MEQSRSLPAILLSLNSASTPQEVSEVALEAVRTFCKADGATLILREGDLCHYADERAISPLWKGSRFLIGSCISGWVMRFNDTAIISDIYRDERIPKDAYRSTFVKSICMVPVGGRNAIAAIGAYWKDETYASPEQVTILHALSNAVYAALTKVQSIHALTNNLINITSDHEVRQALEKVENSIGDSHSPDTENNIRKLGAKLVSRIPFSGVSYSQLDLISLLQSGLTEDIKFNFDKSPALINGSSVRLSDLYSVISKLSNLNINLESNDEFVSLKFKGDASSTFTQAELAKLIYLATTHYSTINFKTEQSHQEISLKFPVARGFTSVESVGFTPLLHGQKVLLLTTELSASKDLTSILNSHGAEVVLAQNNLSNFEGLLDQKPTVALLYHKAETGNCSFAEVLKSLHLSVTENIPFVHVTDGTCSENSPLHNRRTIWLNSKTPNFPNTMAYSIAGVLAVK